MAYEVLARKWRPQVFEEVVGQEHATRTLMNAIRSGRVAQAYLFSGARGVGKTSVARIFAKALNCEAGEPGVPCNRCRSCLEITDGSSVDVQEIDGASNRGIDEIRELRENIRYMPSASRYRVYIIDEVHMLTMQAFNALLKTLEEPPAHVRFIFATTEPHKVPVTILSRCQRFDFKRIPLPRIVEHLDKVVRKEGITISPEALTTISRAAAGSMRDAQSLLDQVVAFTGNQVDDTQVLEILGIIDRNLIFETGRALLGGDSRACLETVDRAYNSGYDIKEFYRGVTEHFRNLMVSLVSGDDHLLEMSVSERKETREQAEAGGEAKIQTILNFLIQREDTLRRASSPRLVLETLLIKLCHLGEYLSFESILERMESLERALLGQADTDIRPSSPPPSPEAVDLTVRKDEASRRPEEENAKTDTWPEFMRFLSSKSRPMSSILKDWRLQSIGDETIELMRSPQGFSASYFEDAERTLQFSAYLREFFGRPLKLRIIDPPSHDAAPKKAPSKPVHTGKKGYVDLPPPVQDVLNLFEGRIEDPAGEHVSAEGADQKPEEEVSS